MITLKESQNLVEDFINFGNVDLDQDTFTAIKNIYKNWYELKYKGKFYTCMYCKKETFSKRYTSHCKDEKCKELYKKDCYAKHITRVKDEEDWYSLYRRLYLRFQGRVRKDRPHTEYDVELFNTYKKQANEWKKVVRRGVKTGEEFKSWLIDYEHKGEIALIARVSAPDNPKPVADEIYNKLRARKGE